MNILKDLSIIVIAFAVAITCFVGVGVLFSTLIHFIGFVWAFIITLFVIILFLIIIVRFFRV